MVELTHEVGSGASERSLHDLRAAMTAIRITIKSQLALAESSTERDIRKAEQLSRHVETLDYAIEELCRLISRGVNS